MGSPMKKSESLKEDKIHVLDLSINRNTKIKIDSLGDVELNGVSIGDTIEIAKILEEKITDRDFVATVLARQLIKPETNFGTIQNLPDTDLEKLANAFVKAENCTFEYFNDTGNCYKDFRQALKTGHEKQIERLRKTYEPIVKSAQETLTTFSKNYASVIQQTLDGTSYIQESLTVIAEVAKKTTDTRFRFVETIKPALEQTQVLAKVINESLRPQIDFWQKWAEQNKRIFDGFSNFWTEFQQKYNIAAQKAAGVLRKYKWFITPSISLPFVFKVVKVGEKDDLQDETINNLFIEYFEAENWHNLATMVNSLKNNSLLEKRYKILNDCIETIRVVSKEKINVANAVLPTLITQIDGALSDYMEIKEVAWSGYVDRNNKVRANKPKIFPTDEMDNQATDVLLNILFQASQRGHPLNTPFDFNRHKIIHGENVEYGRNDYMIRAFMILDLLAHF